MSILNSFDPDSKPLFTPEQLYGTREQIAEVCIVSFHHKVLERVLAEYHPAAAARAFTANGPVELYLLELDGRPTLFYMSPIGAPAAGARSPDRRRRWSMCVPEHGGCRRQKAAPPPCRCPSSGYNPPALRPSHRKRHAGSSGSARRGRMRAPKPRARRFRGRQLPGTEEPVPADREKSSGDRNRQNKAARGEPRAASVH